MIRRYGLYSRRAKKRKMLTWAERIYRDFKRNPLSCNKCGTSMELMYLYNYKYGFFLPKIKIYISPP